MNTQEPLEGIAVVGMAGRFPAAHSVDEFWRNLVDARECSTQHSVDELVARGLPRRVVEAPNFVRLCPVVDIPEIVDPGSLGLSDSQAQALDPQVRMLLLCARDALAEAGCSPREFAGSVGIWAGCGFPEYALKRVLFDLDPSEIPENLAQVNASEIDNVIVTLTRCLGLNGPAVRVQTACSTSLVAIHAASNALLNYQCDLALAGGVSLQYTRVPGFLYFEGEIFSPDGHCRTFDEKANGTVLGEGCGIVALRRLEDAVAAGDRILAVIRGSAVNNDGESRAGYTAPGVAGQAALISSALVAAGVHPDQVGYIEAHGTGTLLGDPIEVTALTKAFRASTDRRGYCGLGSVKPNVGHLDAAAGVTGFIKTVCSLLHRQLPPTLHFQVANPELKLPTTPFFVVDKLMDWKDIDGRCLGGVSSFGLGGTNCHVVLERFDPGNA